MRVPTAGKTGFSKHGKAARSWQRSRRRIVLTLVGPGDESWLEALVPMLDDILEADSSVMDPIALPEHAYNPSRRQYHSAALLDTLAQHKRPEWERLLGVTDVDLYTPNLNFVFGQADSRRGVAVFSAARLHTDDHERFVHRAATEAIHELAHTYGLGHCNDARCVMWFSNTLEETDRKGTRFCATHTSALRQALTSNK
jgi:archaemetzincin